MVNKYENYRNPRKLIDILYHDNYSCLLQIAASHPDCAPLAEHLVQEVFLEALRRFDSLVSAKEPDQWLLEILQDKIRLLFQNQKRQSAEERLQWRADMKLLWEKFGSVDLSCVRDAELTCHEKLLFQLYYLECDPLDELAALEGVSPRRLRSYLDRILQKLL